MYSDGSLTRYLASGSPTSPLAGSGSLARHLEPSDTRDAEKPPQSVFSDSYGSLARYLGDG